MVTFLFKYYYEKKLFERHKNTVIVLDALYLAVSLE